MAERVLQPEPPATAAGNPDEDLVRSRPFYDRAAFPVLLGIVVYAALRNLAQATIKPLWFDELITQVMTRQSSLSALWSALKSAADSNPPGFYLIERAAVALPLNEHIAYRLASVVAFSFTLICLYWLVERRSGPLRALLCASLLLVTPLFTLYADEARPYSVLIACISFALVCYQREPGALWTFGLFACLTLAMCLHYYAVFALLPFLAAELVLTCQTRRPRYFVWIALLLSLAPVLVFRPLWEASKTYYGFHIWSRPRFTDVLDSYGSFFQVGRPWGLALVALCVAAVLRAVWPRDWPAKSVEGRQMGPLQEPVLALGFIAFPLIVFVSAELVHGAVVPRYFLCAILGIVLGLRCVLDWLPSRAVLAGAALLLVVIVSQELGFWTDFAQSAPTAGAALSLEALADSLPQKDLPWWSLTPRHIL